MTFSIVAIDEKNKEVGFAIASCCWNAGLVCAAKPEIGAIASQAKGNLKFLPIFFDKLEENESLDEILSHFKEIDESIESRQIGMVTFTGDALAFSGEKNSNWAGHKTGKTYACQGNILVGPEVVENMSTAFENTEGTLKDKLLAALVAGDNAGGDARGKQSARLCVMKKGEGLFGSGIEVDITIEDHDEPVKEISRILSVRSNLFALYQMYGELKRAETKEEQLTILDKASKFLEDKKECRYFDIWTSLGVEYLELGETEKAITIFRAILEIGPKYRKNLKELFQESQMAVYEQIMKK